MRIVLLVAALVAAMPAIAAPTITPAELARIAPPPKPHPLRDAKIAEVISYGASAAHSMDYYKPTGAGPHPAVVIVHGGGWVGGTKRSGSEAYAADWLAPAGYAVFSIDYRLAPGATWADQVADVQRAIRFVRRSTMWTRRALPCWADLPAAISATWWGCCLLRKAQATPWTARAMPCRRW